MTAYTIVVHVLALVGLLSILASVGVWIFSARIDEPRRDVTDVLAEPTNVRVVRETNAAPTLPVAPVSEDFMRGVVNLAPTQGTSTRPGPWIVTGTDKDAS